MKSRRIIVALNALLIAALACTIGQAPAADGPDLPATITAQALTLQAPTQTPGPPTDTPTPAATNTPTVPQVSVSSATNCRTGPSVEYDLLWTMQPGRPPKSSASTRPVVTGSSSIQMGNAGSGVSMRP
ncbi:MAG: hypothetical protein V1755_11025 [Chloroflexota bacterium]